MSGNFFMMSNDIFNGDITPYEFTVYSYLMMKADRKTMNCYPTVANNRFGL